METCDREFSDPRQKQLLKNIMYVGALAKLLDISLEAIEVLLSEQFKGKEKLVSLNMKALKLGSDYVEQNFSFPLPFKVEKEIW